MVIQLLHVSDIHFGSGELHGRTNPETGLNIRFEDFVRALSRTVDYAIDSGIDVFLFSGDAYKNASPAPIYQKMFARELHRLSRADIATVLVVGNHDQILRSTESHSLSVFQSLEVPGVTIIDRPASTSIDTASGKLQLLGLPHVTRHNLMTLEKYGQLPAAKLDSIIVGHVEELLKGYYEKLDNSIPTVVTAHMSLDRAVAGIEEELLVGYTLTFPTDIFVHPNVDYVALGHIHKHQVIRESDPTIVYAGSLERVDFGEAGEDKGFVHVQLERGNTSFQFHSINPRPFITVDADLTGALKDTPTDKLIAAIEKQNPPPGSVLRIRCRVDQEVVTSIDESAILNHELVADCLSVRLIPEVVPQASRSRLPQLTEASVSSPVDALSSYLDDVLAVKPARKKRLLTRARSVIETVNRELNQPDDSPAT